MLHISVGIPHGSHISAAANTVHKLRYLVDLTVINTVPGQLVVEHALVSLDESPTHSLPPSVGSGLVQVLIRVFTPSPHVTEQSPHSPHEFQLPSPSRKHINADFEQKSNSRIACVDKPRPTYFIEWCIAIKGDNTIMGLII